jgi:hypothetical protein
MDGVVGQRGEIAGIAGPHHAATRVIRSGSNNRIDGRDTFALGTMPKDCSVPCDDFGYFAYQAHSQQTVGVKVSAVVASQRLNENGCWDKWWPLPLPPKQADDGAITRKS